MAKGLHADRIDHRGAIIVLLAGLVVPQYIKQGRKPRPKRPKPQIEVLGTALDTFRLDVGRYPTTQEGFQALNQKPGGVDRWDGPYLKKGCYRPTHGKSPMFTRAPAITARMTSFPMAPMALPGGQDTNRDITSWEK